MINIIIVSDIFGRTPALKTMGKTLAAGTGIKNLEFADPYDGIDHNFKTENDAYKYFTDHIGLTKYQSILIEHLNIWQTDTILIGFSVGASAIWAISNQKRFSAIKKAFCFYGSQIRHKPEIQPVFDIELIFPKKEPHFDVGTLIGHLKDKDCVTCRKATAFHGFMNELSDGYDPDCYASQINDLQRSLSRFV